MSKFKKWIVLPYLICEHNNEEKIKNIILQQNLNDIEITRRQKNFVKAEEKDVTEEIEKNLPEKESIFKNDNVVENEKEILKTPLRPLTPLNIKKLNYQLKLTPRDDDFSIDPNSSSFMLPPSKNTRNHKSKRKLKSKNNSDDNTYNLDEKFINKRSKKNKTNNFNNYYKLVHDSSLLNNEQTKSNSDNEHFLDFDYESDISDINGEEKTQAKDNDYENFFNYKNTDY